MFRHVFRSLITVYFRHERGRTLLALFGVALGVAVLIAINLAIESAVTGFKDTLSDVAGEATLVVRPNTTAIPPETAGWIAGQPGIRAAAPLIEGKVYAEDPADSAAAPETMLLLGVDMLFGGEADFGQVRDIEFVLDPELEFGELLTNPDVLLFTLRFAKRRGLEPGDTVPLIINGHERVVRVGGVVAAGPLADAMDGNVVIGDLGVTDMLLNKHGMLDRIDLVTEPDADLDALAARLEGELPPGLRVERPETRGRQVDSMLAAFRFNLDALGYISILVGAFLIFNTMHISVMRRMPEIGTMRAMGVSSMQVRGAFLTEGALMGAAGSVAGIVLGMLLAHSLLGLITSAISINFVEIPYARLVPAPGIILRGLVLGVGGSTLAALGPANLAARTPPANTIRRGRVEGAAPRLAGPMAGGVALLVCVPVVFGASARAMELAGGSLPWPGYLASLLIVLAFVWFSKPLLYGLTFALKRVFTVCFGAEGLIAVSGTRAALNRSGVAISGLLIALGMTVSIIVMVGSFRDTVQVWMRQVLRADLYVSASTPNTLDRAARIPAAIISAVESIPGVRFVDPARVRPIQLGDRPAYLGAGRFGAERHADDLRLLDGRSAQQVITEARAKRQVIVSEAFYRKFGLGAGDTVTIPTPRGEITPQIAGVYFDYSTEQGYVIMDYDDYMKYWDDPEIDSMGIYLEPGADATVVRRAIEQAAADIPGAPPLQIRATGELRGFAIQAFDRTFRITYVMELIAIVIAMLGVANTLLSQIIDRRDEILTLRAIGVSRPRVAKLVILESGLVGLAGVALGLVAGLILSWILAKVIMLQSFGWTIQYAVPWWTVAQVAVVVCASTLLAGILPAREATRICRAQGRMMGA